jgi:acyl-CoA-binding protein
MRHARRRPAAPAAARWRALHTSATAAAGPSDAFKAAAAAVNALPPAVAPSRALHTSATAAAGPSDAFKAAAAAVNALPPAKEPPPDVKLELYALFKQATAGRCAAPKPGMFDVVGRAKWDAWSALGDLAPADAEARYLALAARLGAGAAAAPAPPPPATATASAASPYTTIRVATAASTGVCTLTLARPEKRNAISWAMYAEVLAALRVAADDDAVRVLVVTGEGPFYSAGNDLSNFLQVPPPAQGGPQAMAAHARATMEAFVGALVDFPKLLVAGEGREREGMIERVDQRRVVRWAYTAVTTRFRPRLRRRPHPRRVRSRQRPCRGPARHDAAAV